MNAKLVALGAALLFGVAAAVAPAAAQVVEVDNGRLKTLLADGAVVVDIRTPPEWAQTGVIPGSHRMTFFDANGNYDVRAWLEQLSSVAGPEDPVVLICQTGQRTALVSRFLSSRVGYSHVYNVTRGIAEWMREENATVR